MFTVNKNPTRDDLRKFGRAMLIGFGTIGAVLWYLEARNAGHDLTSWTGAASQIASVVLWGLGLLLLFLSLASPVATRAIYIAWMSVTVPIGIVMSTILLTVLFILILPVFCAIVRLSDPLRKKLTAGGTYWEDYKTHEATLDRMRRPF